MAKKVKNTSNSQNEVSPKMTIAPTTDESVLCPLRIKEIKDLVAEIIILGTKRGRSSHKLEELKDVA